MALEVSRVERPNPPLSPVTEKITPFSKGKGMIGLGDLPRPAINPLDDELNLIDGSNQWSARKGFTNWLSYSPQEEAVSLKSQVEEWGHSKKIVLLTVLEENRTSTVTPDIVDKINSLDQA